MSTEDKEPQVDEQRIAEAKEAGNRVIASAEQALQKVVEENIDDIQKMFADQEGNPVPKEELLSGGQLVPLLAQGVMHKAMSEVMGSESGGCCGSACSGCESDC